MKHFAYSLIFTLSCFVSFAQEGGYFLAHYSSNQNNINNVNFDIGQDNRGIICIANRSGVIRFDGQSWELIKTPESIFSLAIDESNVIYTGGTEGLGKIERNKENLLVYNALQLNQPFKNVFDLLIKDDELYAINSTSVLVYNIKTNEQYTISSDYSGDMLGLSIIKNTVHVNTTISGLKAIQNKQLNDPIISKLTSVNVEFIFSDERGDKFIIGTSDNELFIYENELKKLQLDNGEGYLKENLLLDGEWINDEIVAIATLKGGIVFINPKEEKIDQVINYQSGLPDNEIYAITTDKYKGLWVSHAEGFTRVSPNFPFRSFEHYPGLQGQMTTVAKHNNTIYIGTTLGAFYLDEIKDYETRIVTVAQRTRTTSPEEQEESVEDQKKRKGLFGFLKRNEKQEGEKAKTSKTRSAITYVRKEEKELQSIRYEFKKFDAIHSKTTRFISAGNRLFCGGLDGLFELKDSVAVNITRAPIRQFHVSTKHNMIIANTYNDDFKAFRLDNKYGSIELFSDFRDYVTYIFEGINNRIWFCSNNEVYWVQIQDNQIVDGGEYNIKNPYFFDTYGVHINDTTYFLNESGILRYEQSLDSLVQENNETIRDYFADNQGALWISYLDQWKTVGKQIPTGHLSLLNIFSDLKYVYDDESKGGYFVITGQNHLYWLKKDLQKNQFDDYSLFLKKIKTTHHILAPTTKFNVNEENSPLVFEFVRPEYSGVVHTLYQYKLEGINDEWSEWSPGYNVINIPYLPDGKYSLKVRAKNLLTGIEEIEPITFQVLPPYWKRPWFLAFEFSAMAFLLFISVKIKQLGYRYRMLSRLLALLTLIIIIEFIQTVAENRFGTETSPVIDFIIQIIIAIIVFPVEGLLRKYIFKEKNVQVLEFLKFKKS